MLQSEIEVGGVYALRWHDGSFTEVRINHVVRFPVRRRGQVVGTKTRYGAINLKTGRAVVIKSAAKLRERVR